MFSNTLNLFFYFEYERKDVNKLAQIHAFVQYSFLLKFILNLRKTLLKKKYFSTLVFSFQNSYFHSRRFLFLTQKGIISYNAIQSRIN